MTVDYKTEGGTASKDEDYKSAMGELSFAPGDTRKTIRVRILKDGAEEETETFKLTLSNVSGGARLEDGKAVAVGKIIGDMERRIEFVNRSILPDIGRALAFAPVRCRLDRAFSGLAADRKEGFVRVSLSPVPGSLPPDSLRGSATDTVPPPPEQALREWSFLVPSAEGPEAAERVTAWGCGDYLRLDGGGEDGVVAWDGEVLSMEFGADVSLGPSVLAGVSVSRATGSFDYHAGGRGEGASGEHDLRLTGVHPYLGWSVSPSVDVWGTVGRASGELRISDDIARGSVTRSVTVDSGAVGVIGRLPGRGATKFKLRGEAGLAQLDLEGAEAAIGAVKLDLRRLRFSTEASHEYELSSGASLTPRGEVGLRYDGGGGETGAGLEVGTGVRHRNPDTGWTTEGFSRWLAAHEDSSLREWGFGARVRLDPGKTGRGPSLSLRQSWGGTASGVQRLWDRGATDPTLDDARPTSLDVKLGYGFAAFRGLGVLTPYGAMSLDGEHRRDHRLGGRLSIGRSATVSLEAGRRELPAAAALHAVWLRSTVRF